MNNQKHQPGPWDYVVTEGLTLRQHYAGLAMQGKLANSYTSGRDPKELAEEAVLYADALINELNKTPEDV